MIKIIEKDLTKGKPYIIIVVVKIKNLQGGAKFSTGSYSLRAQAESVKFRYRQLKSGWKKCYSTIFVCIFFEVKSLKGDFF